MRKWLTIIFLSVGLVGVALWAGNSFANSLAQCASISITVNGADSTRCESTGSSGPLATLLAQVAPRMTFVFADATRIEPLQTAPADLANRLAAVPDRIWFTNANNNRIESLSQPPSEFASNLSRAQDRIWFRYADAAQSNLILVFPLEIIDDTTPPNVQLSTLSTRETVIWTTNEFAACIFEYGLSQNNLNQRIDNDRIRKSHAADIIGIGAMQIFFYKITCTDLSNNTSSSSIIEVNVAPTPAPATPTPQPTSTPEGATGSDTLIFLPLAVR